ncbi:MAG: uncharacterized protein KVP18_000080 [Porospora cf. gigantea A]|uniref:uncharacterized protein n=1 Tax=Porospora cf. gigantea A TaxID=2853593 RepID=UPI003559A386|nr:MAG: hypothetical protein KVP18_000080 [Porospora cf. gigantea A]
MVSSSSDLSSVVSQQESVESSVPQLDVLTPQQLTLMKAFSFLIGVNTLIVYNMFLNVMLSFEAIIWPGHLFNDLCGGFNQLAAMLVTFYFMWKPKMSTHTKTTLYCGVTAVVVGLALPFIPHFLHGNENFTAAVVLLCIATFILGLTAGAFQCQGFAYAVITDKPTITYVSLGNGFAGVYSFVMYTIFFEGVFDKDNRMDQVNLCWVLFVSGAIVAVVQLAFSSYIFRQEWFVNRLEAHQMISDNSSAVHQEDRSFKDILKDTYKFAFASGWIFFVTICVYPMVGPFSWPLSSTWMNALNGVFQVGDMIFRFIPELGGRWVLSRRVSMISTVVRPLIFFPLFLLPARVASIGFLDNEWFLLFVMLIFVLSNGWLATCNQIHCMEGVSGRETNAAANILTVGIISEVTVSLFFSKVFIL